MLLTSSLVLMASLLWLRPALAGAGLAPPLLRPRLLRGLAARLLPACLLRPLGLGFLLGPGPRSVPRCPRLLGPGLILRGLLRAALLRTLRLPLLLLLPRR